MPGLGTVYVWLRNHPDFRRLHTLALMLREDIILDQTRDLAAGGATGDRPALRVAKLATGATDSDGT